MLSASRCFPTPLFLVILSFFVLCPVPSRPVASRRVASRRVASRRVAYNMYSNDNVVLICETQALLQIVTINTKKTFKKSSTDCDKEEIIRKKSTVRISPLYEVWSAGWTGYFLKCLEQRKICFENDYWAIGVYVICRPKRRPLKGHWLCGAKFSFRNVIFSISQ